MNDDTTARLAAADAMEQHYDRWSGPGEDAPTFTDLAEAAIDAYLAALPEKPTMTEGRLIDVLRRARVGAAHPVDVIDVAQAILAELDPPQRIAELERRLAASQKISLAAIFLADTFESVLDDPDGEIRRMRDEWLAEQVPPRLPLNREHRDEIAETLASHDYDDSTRGRCECGSDWSFDHVADALVERFDPPTEEWEYTASGEGLTRNRLTEAEAAKWRARGYTLRRRLPGRPAGPWEPVPEDTPTSIHSETGEPR